MNDPRRPQDARDFFGPAQGMATAVVPMGAVGCFAGLFLLLLAAIGLGLAHGPWLIAAIAGMVVLVPLIKRALKREMRRDDARFDLAPHGESSLPDDAELSDAERRRAMREYDQEHHDRE